jgi:hypothetical protein
MIFLSIMYYVELHDRSKLAGTYARKLLELD